MFPGVGVGVGVGGGGSTVTVKTLCGPVSNSSMWWLRSKYFMLGPTYDLISGSRNYLISGSGKIFFSSIFPRKLVYLVFSRIGVSESLSTVLLISFCTSVLFGALLLFFWGFALIVCFELLVYLLYSVFLFSHLNTAEFGFQNFRVWGEF